MNRMGKENLPSVLRFVIVHLGPDQVVEFFPRTSTCFVPRAALWPVEGGNPFLHKLYITIFNIDSLVLWNDI